MRALITGAAGQLGHALVAAFEGRDLVACDSSMLDLNDRDSVFGAVTTAAPDVILHAGAWTAVDACEDDPDRAFRVNVIGTRHVVAAARVVGARVLYVSTDYVFDGRAEGAYDEWAATNPLSVYGRSKLAGERELDPGATIVRTSWLWSPGGSNFVTTMLRLAAERDEISVVADQIGCPTYAGDLAAAIRRLVDGRLSGTFHVTNQGETSWFELAQAVLAAAGHDPAKVKPTTTVEYAARAPRPARAVLDNRALRLVGLPPLPHWQEPLERLVKEC
jgi:dTDP-4-dehydrorhamnose reductase